MGIIEIEKSLRKAYTFLVVPDAMMDFPVELEKTKEYDENSVLIETYSMNRIHELLGDKFKPVVVIDTRYKKFRWSVQMNGEASLIENYLISKGLVNMRDNGIADSLNYTVEEIDFTALNGNEFGIFSAQEIDDVPVPALEEIV